MPTYQYVCTNREGKHEFELVQSFTDAPVTECPECGAAVRKVYGSVGVVFKGSGFYRTDSRKAAASESSSSDGSSSPSKEKSSSAKEGASTSSSSSSSSSKDGGSSSTAPATSGSATPAGSGAKAAG